MKILFVGLLLIPSIALAQDKPKPSPEMQAALFMKDNADQREMNMTLQAFKMREQLADLNAKLAEKDAELAKLKPAQ